MDDPALPVNGNETPAQSAPPDASPKTTARKWLTRGLRWGIAVIGLWWVLTQMSIWDKVLVATPRDLHQPVKAMMLAEPDASETQPAYHVVGRADPVPRSDVLNKVAKKNEKVQLLTPTGQPITARLLGLDLEGNDLHSARVARLYVQVPGEPAKFIDPSQVAGGYALKVPYPRVDVGVARLLRQASQQNFWLLVLAIAIFPITFIVTSYRWHELLKALDIHIGLMRTFTLNMVGAFYNTFMPGSTGGDVLKALYVSRQTPHRTRAVMSVLIDRMIGLLALIILGGIGAATQWHLPQCRQIAIASAAIIAGAAGGLTIFYQPTLHRLFFLDWIIEHLPAQKQVQNAVHVMETYRRRPALVFWALLVTFPVHVTVICSAMFAGMAFGLPLSPQYYWAIVPVIVLVGSIPISPQGAGVMEYFAIKLTETRGATVSQAFALTMSIRIVQILWNLTGVYFVLRGHYHKPTPAEQREVSADLALPEAA
jgi:glycosyltransferase 2 family protein